jgi:hypothetical protein
VATGVAAYSIWEKIGGRTPPESAGATERAEFVSAQADFEP